MSTDWVARGLGLASALIGLTSLCWSVLSWRRTGPALRVHAIAYREVLIVRVFNAGRTADSIEQTTLGGSSGGATGVDLTKTLELPQRLEPGESKHWEIEPRAVSLSEWPATVAGGWASLWLLSGSMKQHRTEVMPLRSARPPAAGWRLVPARVKLARYLPFLGVVSLAFATSPGAGVTAEVVTTLLGAFVIVRGFWALSTDKRFIRRRVERWTLAAGWMLSLVLLRYASASPVTDEQPAWVVVVTVGYAALATVLAVPGQAPEVARIAAGARERLRYVSTWFRGSVSRSTRRS